MSQIRQSHAGALTPPGRIAVVGAGAFGQFSIGAYRDTADLDVVAVADTNAHTLAQVAARGARMVTDWREVVTDERVEAIHLATPPFLRSEVIAAALGQGKSVFCEKPLALSLAEADAMIDQAGRHGVALGVDYVMRHQPAYRFLAALAESGLMGQVRSVSLQNFARDVPAEHWFWDPALSGGVLVEHGVHFFDAYGQVAGVPTRVAGHVPRPATIEANVWYHSGAYARFYHEFAFPLAVEVTIGITAFERGHVVIEGWIPTRLHGAVLAPATEVRAVSARIGIAMTVTGGEQNSQFEVAFPRRDASYRAAVMAGMRDIVQSHRDPGHRMTVTAADARASLALALAATRAAGLETALEL